MAGDEHSVATQQEIKDFSAELRMLLKERFRGMHTGLMVSAGALGLILRAAVDVGKVDTPFVPFAINHLGCCGGVQVTASHNPAHYNGFKISKIRAMPVGMIDDFQVSYMVGTNPPVGGAPPQYESADPPYPQLDADIVIEAKDIISGVRVMVTARSASENLEGAETGDSGDYIRRSFSSNISPRNIIGGLAARSGGVGAN